MKDQPVCTCGRTKRCAYCAYNPGVAGNDSTTTTIPTLSIDYSDRAALPMLAARRRVLEDHGLVGPAREVTEQMATVRAWQVANLDKLTPYPGVIPTRLDGAA